MKISDYMPDLYKKNLEMNNIIDSEEIEFEENLKLNIENEFNDTFPIKATEKGIQKYEKILNIVSNTNDESLEFRRQRVINRLVSSIPFTEKYLINYLDNMLGEGNWTYTIDYNDYTLLIQSLIPGKLWYNELILFLQRILPVNIEWTVQLYAASWNAVENHFGNWLNLYRANLTWQEVMDGEWSV